MKNFLKNLLGDRIWKFLWSVRIGHYSYFLRIFPINEKKIIFSNHLGMGVGDSPKYILDYILNSTSGFTCIWLIKDDSQIDINYAKKIKYVKYDSFEAQYHLSTSKYWIDNTRKTIFTPKRKSQIYIQLWHGFGIKKIEKDTKLEEEYIKVAKNDSKMMDYLLSPCETFTNVISKGFWYEGRIIEGGLPRNDILTNSINLDSKKLIEEYLGTKLKDKVILYAPTFRSGYDLNAYDIDFQLLRNSLNNRFNEDYDVLIKFHPNMREKCATYCEVNKGCYDVSNYSDMSELLSMTDILVTDYSSSIMDFILTKRLAIIYAKDYEVYKEDRGVYFSLDSITGTVITSNKDLQDYIESVDIDKYNTNIQQFMELHRYYDRMEGTKQVVKIITNSNY